MSSVLTGNLSEQQEQVADGALNWIGPEFARETQAYFLRKAAEALRKKGITPIQDQENSPN